MAQMERLRVDMYCIVIVKYTWKSQKQYSIALLSIEAEYMGQTMAVATLIWYQNLLHELQISGAIPKKVTVTYADIKELLN